MAKESTKSPKTPKMSKSPAGSDDEADLSSNIIVGSLSPIAVPLADGKLTKRALKVVKKAASNKGSIKRGVKEVVKHIRKRQQQTQSSSKDASSKTPLGMVLLAGDVSPMDVLSHLPVFCEESGVPYVFVPSKAALGLASGTKRATCCIFVQNPKELSTTPEYGKYYEDVFPKVKQLCNL